MSSILQCTRDHRALRWEGGVAFFGMEDILAAGRNPNISSDIEPAYTGIGISGHVDTAALARQFPHCVPQAPRPHLLPGGTAVSDHHLARLELRTTVDQLHRRIPSYTVTPGETPEYHHAGVRAATYLPLSFPVSPSARWTDVFRALESGCTL